MGSGLVVEYNSLLETFPLDTCQDIKTKYEELKWQGISDGDAVIELRKILPSQANIFTNDSSNGTSVNSDEESSKFIDEAFVTLRSPFVQKMF